LHPGEGLGTRQIEGLVCQGSRYHFSGFEEVPGGIIDCWYSELISYVVFVRAVFGEVENIFQLYDIRLVEPSGELFVIPADYGPAKLVIGECSLQR
jgi:hypothetical protein